MIKRYLKKACVYSKKITPHSLRHTAAFMNLAHGGSLEATRLLLRHKHVESTLIYAHQIDRLTDTSEDRIAGVYFKSQEDSNG